MSYVLILNVIIFNEQIKLNKDKQYEKYYTQDIINIIHVRKF